MRTRPLQVLLLFGVLALAACGGTPSSTATPSAPAPTATLPPNPLNVYFILNGSTSGTTLYALSGATGNPLWQHEANTTISNTPVLDHGVVYIGSNASLDALNASDGKLLWSHPAPGTSVVAVADGVVYGSGDSSLFALNASDGSVRWKYQTKDRVRGEMVADGVVYATGSPPPPCQCGAPGPVYTLALSASNGSVLWKAPPDANYHYEAQMVAQGLVYGLDYNGVNDNFLVLHASDGSVAWRFPADPASANVSIIGMDGTMIAVLSNEGQSSQVVYALNASDGSVLWRTPIMNTTALTATLFDHVIYVGSSDNYKPSIYAINAADGKQLWHAQIEAASTPTGAPAMVSAVVNGTVYLSLQQGFAALNASDGSIKWQHQVSGYTAIAAVAYGVVYASATPIVYSGTATYPLYALYASSGTVLWRYDAPNAFNLPVVG